MKKELINKLLSLGASLTVVDGNLKVNVPKGTLTDDLVAEIKRNKEYLIQLVSSRIEIPKAGKRKSYPVTSGQRRLWILSQFDGANAAYNISNELEFIGTLDLEKLTVAFQMIIERHESLRTFFKENSKGALRQHIVPFKEIEFDINFQDFSEAKPQAIAEKVSNHHTYSFDLSKAPLLRVEALKIGKDTHLLLFNLHHIVGDGWSLEVLSGELIQCYNALLLGKETQLAPLPFQYKDYAIWLEADEQQDKLKTAQAYWLEQLKGEIPVLELPVLSKRPKVKTYSGNSLDYQFDTSFFQNLSEFLKEEDASLFMGLMAAVNGLFFRYTNKTDGIIGTALAGRTHADLEQQIGLYLNTLAIRTQFSTDVTFKNLLAIQRKTLMDAYKHQSYPFDVLVEELALQRDVSRSALFDVMVILQNQHEVLAANSGLDGIQVSGYEKKGKNTSLFDLTFSFVENQKGLSVTVEYNTDIYSKDFVQGMLVHLENFMMSAIENYTEPIATIDYLSKEEKKTLVSTFNNTKVEYPERTTFLNSFSEQIKISRDEVALVFDTTSLTYEQLDARSNRLAQYLISIGIKKKTVVALCVDRSCEMVVSILGILKAGATYLPLDPSYPIDRLDYIIKDSKAQLIITKEEILKFIPKSEAVLCLENDKIWASKPNKLAPVSPQLPAYIIYTSGTTGRPKGVTISHKNLFNFFVGLNQKFGPASQSEVWLAVTSMSFDISILELLWTLTRGSKVIIQPDRPTVVSTAQKVDFSLLYFATQEEIQEENKYDLLLKGAVFADKNNLKAVWIPERHFHSFGDQFPNPSVAAAAVAAITENVSIRSGSVVIPLHDTVRVAEEWSMVDNLSEGRVELSVASGWHPNDFVLAPEAYENRHEIMRAKIKTLKDLWAGQSIIRKNGRGDDFEFAIHPRPIQKELKIWVTASRSIETFTYAGSIGANVLTRLLGQGLEDLDENIKAYRQALKDNGFDPELGKVAVMLHTFVSDDLSYVKETVEAPFKNYLRNSVSLMKPVAEAFQLDLENDFEAIVDLVFNRFYESSCLFGTPESCYPRVKALYDIGVNEIGSLLDFGVATDTVLSNLIHLKELDDLVKRNTAQHQFLSKRFETGSTIPQLIERHGVTHLQSTPSFIQELLWSEGGSKALKQIKTLLIGGEALTQTLRQSLMEIREGSIFNMYGPTETTIWSTIKEVTKEGSITIGTPIANTRIYILDPQKQLCPVGVIGELCIAGDGVSLGYLGREELTREKFIEDSFADVDVSTKVYRTGDLARWLPNGELECLGRIDNQVKLRGHRIELEEIENTLRSNEAIIDAAVMVKTHESGAQELQAYIMTQGPQEIGGLRTHLSKYLPQYMIPEHFIPVKEFPLTPNGKLDRKALAALEGESLKETVAYVAPRNDLEKELVSIWEEVLQKEKIGIHDNFFNLGGNSLNAVRIASEIQKRFQIKIEITKLFQEPNIAELAVEVSNHSWQKETIEEEEVTDRIMI